jgi:hypothetical protein
MRRRSLELAISRLIRFSCSIWLLGEAGRSSLNLTHINTINPLKPKLVQIIFNNSVRTAKKTQLFTIAKINTTVQNTQLLNTS